MSDTATTPQDLERALAGASDAERLGVDKTVRRLSRIAATSSGHHPPEADFASVLEDLRHG